MFEVEKKFILTPEQEKSLIEGAEFLGEKKMIDICYDGPDYSLTRQDIWLRNRNGKFELKLPMNVAIEERISDQYRELETDEEILKYFGAGSDENLTDFLAKNKYVPICTFVTTRRKYKKEGFGIDLDSMDFGYSVAEIECMVEDPSTDSTGSLRAGSGQAESKISQAAEAIIVFAKRHYIDTESVVRGKFVEYVWRNNRQHFQALINAKVIK